MTKSELIEAVAKSMPKASLGDVEEVVNTVFETMTKALCEDERVEVRGFGSFSTKTREGRTGRNPRTGEPVDVPKKRVAAFKAGKTLRDRVAGAEGEDRD